MTDFSSIDVEEVLIDLGCEYRRQTGTSGDQFNVKTCPRCGGSKWKVFLNTETGFGNCFHGSCVGQPGYNIFTFTKNSLGDTKEAMRLLDRILGQGVWRPKKKRSQEVHLSSRPTFDASILPNSVELPYKNSVGKYLAKRGFTNETAKYLHWRYSSNGRYTYKREGKELYQDYSKRIIIPILNLKGELVTFQGRDTTGEAEKKYLFPPGLAGTSAYLYNGHNAVGKESVVINEGALDVAATFQAFGEDELLKDVIPVGTFGKMLSRGRADGQDQLGEFLKLKEKGLKKVTVMWDSELSTLKSAGETALLLSGYGIESGIAVLPENSDPNEATPYQVRKAYRTATPIRSKMDLLKFISALKKPR